MHIKKIVLQVMNFTNRRFDKALSQFLTTLRYVRNSDYHGKIIVSDASGIITPIRANCSNENMEKIRKTVSMLYKLDHRTSVNKVLVYTTYQIRFVGQCLMERLLTKYEQISKIAWTEEPSAKQKQKMLDLIRHEKPLQDTFRTLSQSIKLRSRFTNTGDMLYILRILRKCIYWKGFSSRRADEQKKELSHRYSEIKKEYERLSRSTRWKQIIAKLLDTTLNSYTSDTYLLRLHRQRMNGLLERATSIL